ncbi:MAG TPA: VTT domain-containing protein [Usitatibacter sp.]|nr:VTT domain-containing protein [Usitatibacter sp.]
MSRRGAFGLLVALALAALLLALLWTSTPLQQYARREEAHALARAFAGSWWAPLAVVLAYTPASFVMFPRWIITMTAVLAFGPALGFACGCGGILLAAMASYIPGRISPGGWLRGVAGPRLSRLLAFVDQHGVLAVVLVRLFPVAPFPLVNFVLGSIRVRFAPFLAGTFVGMLPGMTAATLLSEQLAAALEDPGRVNPWIVAGVVLGLAALAWIGRRLAQRRAR